MSVDTLHHEHLQSFEAARNREPIAIEFRYHRADTPSPEPCNGGDGYDFSLHYPRKGAALDSLPWIVAFLHARCAPLLLRRVEN